MKRNAVIVCLPHPLHGPPSLAQGMGIGLAATRSHDAPLAPIHDLYIGNVLDILASPADNNV